MNKIRWWHIGVLLLVLALAMLNPITRAIVIFILPLGSGIDDLIFFILVGAGLLILYLGGFQAIFKKFRGE